MKKHKYIPMIFLTCVLIVIGAILPGITSKIQDSLNNEKITYKDMAEIQLNLHDVTTLEKLYLTITGQAVEISEDKTNLKDKIAETVESELQPYIKSGFIKNDLTEFSMEVHPILYYNISSTDISNIFWLVTMECNEDEWTLIELGIDDETGKILTIRYDCKMEIFENSMLKEKLMEFKSIYFNNLDLELQEFEEEYTDIEDYDEDVEGLERTVFRWGDIEYGEFMMQFDIYSSGFYMYFDSNNVNYFDSNKMQY